MSNIAVQGAEQTKPTLRSGPPAVMEARRVLEDLATSEHGYTPSVEFLDALDAFEKAVREATLQRAP